MFVACVFVRCRLRFYRVRCVLLVGCCLFGIGGCVLFAVMCVVVAWSLLFAVCW